MKRIVKMVEEKEKMSSKILLEIEKIIEKFPVFMRSIDLIKLGLYKSRSDLSWSKKRGLAPPSIHLGEQKTVYPRDLLCDWLKEKALNLESNANKSKTE